MALSLRTAPFRANRIAWLVVKVVRGVGCSWKGPYPTNCEVRTST